MSIANPALKAALVVALVASLSTGCQTTTDPYTGEKKTTSTTLGALIGAGAGAAIGMISGHDAKQRRQRALVGAGVGALAGGAIGNYMDRQENELRALMRDSGVTVTRKGEDIVLNMPGNVTFRTGSAEINADIAHQIQVLAQAVSKSPELKIRVDGYADPRGSIDTNMKLSQDRANAVRDLLLASGLSDEALEVKVMDTGTGIAKAPSKPDIVYVGSGEGIQRPDLSVGNGVYRSNDAGRTWTLSKITPQSYYSAVAYDHKHRNPKAKDLDENQANVRLFLVGPKFIYDFRPPTDPTRISPRKKSDTQFNAVSPYPEGGALVVGLKSTIAVIP